MQWCSCRRGWCRADCCSWHRGRGRGRWVQPGEVHRLLLLQLGLLLLAMLQARGAVLWMGVAWQ